MPAFFHRLLKRQPILLVGFLLCLSCAIGLAGWRKPALSQEPSPDTVSTLPELRVHPLPASLEQWQIDPAQGDYLDAIESTPVGALVWSQFPIQVYIEPIDSTDLTGRSQIWFESVRQAIQEWTVYLPLEVSPTAETASISILRTAPPLQRPTTPPEESDPLARLPRVRSAESRYEILIRRSTAAPTQLVHRFTIYLTPTQTPTYTLATARHELGHALGIWGHSPLPTDALYFSQVRDPASISDRDINTLKRIYQQPTRLGWPIPEAQSEAKPSI
jgi:predicted Zn-dependent protease